ncbi:MAG: alpha/beta fold hydrolase, partial [Chloroflexia bacterium]
MLLRAMSGGWKRSLLLLALLAGLALAASSASARVPGPTATPAKGKSPQAASPKGTNSAPAHGARGARNLQEALARPFRTGRDPNGHDSNSPTVFGTCGPMDVAFVIDDTGSMGGALDNVVADIPDILDSIESASGGQYRLSLVTFKDNITVRVNFADTNRSAFESEVRTLFASGGSDTPEASDEALRTVINHLPQDFFRPQFGSFDPAFRSDATKIIVLVSDAVPGGFDDTYTPGIDDVNAHQRAVDANLAGIRITSVYIPDGGFGDPALPIMSDYARTTGGGAIVTDADGRGSASAVSDVITTCGIGNTGAGCPTGSNVTNIPTIPGDDTFNMSLSSSADITTELKIGRFYGPIGSDGHIDPQAYGISVDTFGILKVSATNSGDNMQLTLNGLSFNLPAVSGRATYLVPVDTSAFYLPSRGTPYSPPIPAPNCLILRHNAGSGGRATVHSVELDLGGLRPLALSGGFDASGQDKGIDSSSGSYGGEDGIWASTYPFNWFHYFLNRDGHESIQYNGALFTSQIEQLKTMYGVPKVNIVGFSMGGLFSREYASRDDPSFSHSIDNLMMLGTPNGGATLADAAGILNSICKYLPSAICDLYRDQYDKRGDAIKNLTHQYMAQYNATHPAVPCIRYTDQAGKTRISIPIRVCTIFGCVTLYTYHHTFNGDGVVGVPSVQALPYSLHLPPITYDEDFDKGILVHGRLPKEPPAQDALLPYFVRANNSYGCSAPFGWGLGAAPEDGPRTTDVLGKNAGSTASSSIVHRSSSAAATPAPPVLWAPQLNSVAPGQTQTSTVLIDNAGSATFMLGWVDYPTVTLSLNLTDPSGQVITPTTDYTGSTYLDASDGVLTGVMYEILNPAPGNWQAHVTAPSTASGSEPSFLSGQLEGGVQLNPQLSSATARLGQTIALTSTLQDTAPITGAVLTSTVDLSGSSAPPTVLTLTAQPGGIYTASFTPTQQGAYFVTVFASGTNTAGQPSNRNSTLMLQASSAAELTGTYTEHANPGSTSPYGSLTISATAAITQADRYRLSGELSTTGGALLATATGSYTLTAGTAQLPLLFSGSDIGAGVADGPYRLTNLYFTRVLSDDLLLASLPAAYTTVAYSRFDWPRGDAALAAPPTDQGIDTNANGHYEYLEVTIPLDIKTAGVYSGSLNLMTPSGLPAGSTSFSNLTLSQGRNNVVVRFDSGPIRATAEGGPYKVTDLVIYSASGTATTIAPVEPATQAYHNTDFEISAQYPTATPTTSRTPT